MTRSVIIDKFQRLDDCLNRIESVLKGDSATLKDRSLPLPRTMKEYFAVLADNQVIEADLADRLQKMVGFRNIAVHDYQVIDVAILKAIYEKHLCDFVRFKEQVLTSLKKG